QIMNSLNIDPRNSIDRRHLQRAFLSSSLALALMSSALLPTAKATDGGLPNNNTAEGDFALYLIITNSSNTGALNTAISRSALFNDTTGGSNTATGYDALFTNTAGNFNTATGASALFNNTHGAGNTADGDEA